MLLKGHMSLWVGASRGNQPAKFGSYRHCDSADMIFLVCLVISQDHPIKGLFEFMGKSPLWLATCQPLLLVIGIVVVEICFQFVTWFAKPHG